MAKKSNSFMYEEFLHQEMAERYSRELVPNARLLLCKGKEERVAPSLKRAPLVVAIDGPAGTGKSSIAKALAKEFNLLYFSTGELYRSLAYACLHKNVDHNNEYAVTTMLKYFKLEYKVCQGENGKRMEVFFEGKNITSELHSEIISRLTPISAQYPAVREHYRAIQREIARTTNVVMEGRDICSVVLPNADYKFFITASAEARAERRFFELRNKESVDFKEILADIRARDEADSTRHESPMIKTTDSVLVDTSNMNLEESIEAVAGVIRAGMSKEAQLER